MSASDARQVDAETVAALRRGDEATFTALVRRHQPAFLRIARVWAPSSSGDSAAWPSR